MMLAAAAAAAAAMGASAQRGTETSPSPLPLKEFMGHVMQRNAMQLWRWTAFEIDEKGERSGKPQTEEQWEEAESDALTVQQLTYVLEHSPFRGPDGKWDAHLAGLRAAATASAAAAERKDFDAMEAAGNDLNEQCVACHITFAPGLEGPPPPS